MPQVTRQTRTAFDGELASRRDIRRAKRPTASPELMAATQASATAPAPSAPQNDTPTKRALVLNLLQSDRGATIQDLVSATGWLAHTTRAALTRLRQAGHQIQRSEGDSGSVYRIAPPLRARRSRKAA